MMFYCPVCGRRRFVHQPQFWPYRFDGEMFCSENCWICDSTRKMMERKGFNMARMKKDGTPAKKPGPKAGRKPASEKKTETVIKGSPEEVLPKVKLTGPIRIETPEANRVEVVETPEKPVQPLTFAGFEITALRHQDLGEFYYDKKYNSVDWRTLEGDEVSLSPMGWQKMLDDLPKIMKLLGVET